MLDRNLQFTLDTNLNNWQFVTEQYREYLAHKCSKLLTKLLEFLVFCNNYNDVRLTYFSSWSWSLFKLVLSLDHGLQNSPLHPFTKAPSESPVFVEHKIETPLG